VAGRSTIYAPQRVGFRPPSPRGLQIADPRVMLMEALKGLVDKNTQSIMNQSPASVMGALSNPGDVAPGMQSPLMGSIERRARMMTGGL